MRFSTHITEHTTFKNALVAATISLMIAAILFSKVWFYLTGDIRAVVSSVPDDTAYFYKIAWNVVHGKGLTFDGINPTNGFQPLWLYVLLPLAWIFRDASPENYFRAALVYQAVIVIGAGLPLFFALRRVTSLPVALMTLAGFYAFSRNLFMNGMETGCLVLCLNLLLFYTLKYRIFISYNPTTALGFGGLLGLLLLARLDMIFLIAIIYLLVAGRVWALWRAGANTSAIVRDAVLSLIALIAVSSPYFVYNKLVFGSVMPISGALKNSFPYVLQPEFGLKRFNARSLIAVGAALAFCLWYLFTLRSRLSVYADGTRLLDLAVFVSALTTLIHYLNTALFMKWAVFGWHFTIYHLSLCLIFASVANYLLNRLLYLRRLSYPATAIVVLLVSTYPVATADRLYRSFGWHAISYEAAVWARNNTPPNTIFAMKDAGIFGLFSMRPVINLDGLVNNLEYQEYLRKGQLNEYLYQKGVEYIVQHSMQVFCERQADILLGKYNFLDFPYRSQLYPDKSDTVRFYKSDEVFRRVYYEKALDQNTALIIWRFRYTSEKASR